MVWHLLGRFRVGRQTEIDAAIVVLLRGRRQIEVSHGNLVMTTGGQVVQRVSNHGVVLNFKLAAVFEDQNGLRLVGNRGFFRWRRGNCLGFRSIRSMCKIINVGASWLSGTTAVEDGGPATVVLVFVALLVRLVRSGITGVGFSNYRICVRNVDRSSRREELTALMMVALANRRIWTHREQWIDAARGLIEKRVRWLNSVRAHRSDAGGNSRCRVNVSAKIGRAYRCRSAVDLRGGCGRQENQSRKSESKRRYRG